MKITYPECQVDITAEELIMVIDHFTTKTTCNTEPTFEPGGIINTDDGMPEPRPYPNMLDHEAIIQRKYSGFYDIIKKALEEAEAQGKLQEVKIPTEEAPVESPSNFPVESTKGRNHASTKKEDPTTDSTKKKKASGKPKKVDILFENGWKTFNSISQAAKSIDARLNHLSHALLNGKTCNGHHVRYHSEMDDIMAEIKERDRKPYETSKPIR